MFAQAHRQKRSFARVANIWNRKIVIHRRRYILGNTLFKNRGIRKERDAYDRQLLCAFDRGEFLDADHFKLLFMLWVRFINKLKISPSLFH